jgi:hypothetical protein
VGAYWLQSAWSQLRIIDRSREILICRVWFRDSVVGGMPVAARADDERSLYLFGPRPTVWGLVADPHLGGRVGDEVPRIGRAARISGLGPPTGRRDSPCGFGFRPAPGLRRAASPPPKLGGVGSGGEVNPKSPKTCSTLRGALVAEREQLPPAELRPFYASAVGGMLRASSATVPRRPT